MRPGPGKSKPASSARCCSREVRSRLFEGGKRIRTSSDAGECSSIIVLLMVMLVVKEYRNAPDWSNSFLHDGDTVNFLFA